jgi:DNA-binding NarL/FixJ family response regulator
MRGPKLVQSAKAKGRKAESRAGRIDGTVPESELRFRLLLESVADYAESTGDASRELVTALKSLAQQKRSFVPRWAELTAKSRAKEGLDKTVLGVLTKRQRETLKLLAIGKSTKEAASELGISPKTADAHRAHIMQKLGLHSQSDLIFFAIRAGIITP